MIYDVHYFIKKFEAMQVNCIGRGTINNRCALWHLGVTETECGLYKMTEEAVQFSDLLKPIFNGRDLEDFKRIYYLNDGYVDQYKQFSPKQRILAALYDIKKMQDKDTVEIPKEKIRYVSVPSSITEQTKELIMQ